MERDPAENAFKACIQLMNKNLANVNGLMNVAAACMEAGQTERAFDTVLDIEPLLFEANHLLQAATLFKRQISKSD